MLDCEETYEEIADLVGKETAGELALVSFVHRKNLFRDGFFSCEGSVDVSESPKEVHPENESFKRPPGVRGISRAIAVFEWTVSQ